MISHPARFLASCAGLALVLACTHTRAMQDSVPVAKPSCSVMPGHAASDRAAPDNPSLDKAAALVEKVRAAHRGKGALTVDVAARITSSGQTLELSGTAHMQEGRLKIWGFDRGRPVYAGVAGDDKSTTLSRGSLGQVDRARVRAADTIEERHGGVWAEQPTGRGAQIADAPAIDWGVGCGLGQISASWFQDDSSFGSYMRRIAKSIITPGITHAGRSYIHTAWSGQLSPADGPAREPRAVHEELWIDAESGLIVGRLLWQSTGKARAEGGSGITIDLTRLCEYRITTRTADPAADWSLSAKDLEANAPDIRIDDAAPWARRCAEILSASRTQPAATGVKVAGE